MTGEQKMRQVYCLLREERGKRKRIKMCRAILNNKVSWTDAQRRFAFAVLTATRTGCEFPSPYGRHE